MQIVALLPKLIDMDGKRLLGKILLLFYREGKKKSIQKKVSTRSVHNMCPKKVSKKCTEMLYAYFMCLK